MASSNWNISIDFQRIEVGGLEDSISQFTWYNPPQNYYLEENKGLCIVPKSKTDFWRKTYHIPPANRTSGHALLYKVPPSTQCWEVMTEFSLSPTIQYDQAGLMVYIDDRHWLKAGIEFEDGSPKISCVVTNEESDWNYLAWPTSFHVKIRVVAQQYDSVCECKVEYKDEGKWKFLREAPLFLGNSSISVSVGPMCCAPKKESESGMKVLFHSLEMKMIS